MMQNGDLVEGCEAEVGAQNGGRFGGVCVEFYEELEAILRLDSEVLIAALDFESFV